MDNPFRRLSLPSLPAVPPAKAQNAGGSFPQPATTKYAAGQARRHTDNSFSCNGAGVPKSLKRAKSLQPIRHSRKAVEQEINNLPQMLPNGKTININK